MVRVMRGGRRGGGPQRPREEGPPEEIREIGEVIHPSEGNQLLCKSSIEDIPWFNKNIYLENKAEIGKVDEILGPTTNFVTFT